MEELTIDLTYGTALFEAARETGKTDLINEEAGQLIELFGQEPDLHKFVNTPGISAEEKKNVLENVFRGRICDRASELPLYSCRQRQDDAFRKNDKDLQKTPG